MTNRGLPSLVFALSFFVVSMNWMLTSNLVVTRENNANASQEVIESLPNASRNESEPASKVTTRLGGPKVHPNNASESKPSTAIFCNVYTAPGSSNLTLNIVNEQLTTWRESSIAQTATLHYALLGEEIQMPCAATGETCQQLPNVNSQGNEEETLQHLHEYCVLHPNDKVVYMHTKGSFHDNAGNRVLRRLLTKSIFSEACLGNTLDDECDVCSARFSPLPHWHAPGNMWVASCRYIHNLLPPKQFAMSVDKVVEVAETVFGWGARKHEALAGEGRFANEHWILTHPEVKPCDVYPESWTWRPTAPLNLNATLQRVAAPRFPRKKYKLTTHSGAWMNIGYRLFEMHMLYSKVPPENCWVWDFYMKQGGNIAKGLPELRTWNESVWSSVPSQYRTIS